jgi:hypothetical protein
LMRLGSRGVVMMADVIAPERTQKTMHGHFIRSRISKDRTAFIYFTAHACTPILLDAC